MLDDDTTWTFRRRDVIRTGLFVAAMIASTALALWSSSWRSASHREVVLVFTFGCIAAGAALGVILSMVELVAAMQVEGHGRERAGAPTAGMG